jgi:hypothetical protein
VSGKLVVVGSLGIVYIYTITAGNSLSLMASGVSYSYTSSMVVKLTGPSSFGSSVFIDGSSNSSHTIVVGAPTEAEAYIYYGCASDSSNTCNDNDGEKLSGPQGSEFGHSVAIAGTSTLLIGAYGLDNSTGGAYVYYGTTCAFAGMYFNDNTGLCTLCAAGTYSIAGSSSCLTCEAGTYSITGSSACISCSSEMYSSVGATSCFSTNFYQFLQTGFLTVPDGNSVGSSVAADSGTVVLGDKNSSKVHIFYRNFSTPGTLLDFMMHDNKVFHDEPNPKTHFAFSLLILYFSPFHSHFDRTCKFKIWI